MLYQIDLSKYTEEKIEDPIDKQSEENLKRYIESFMNVACEKTNRKARMQKIHEDFGDICKEHARLVFDIDDAYKQRMVMIKQVKYKEISEDTKMFYEHIHKENIEKCEKKIAIILEKMKCLEEFAKSDPELQERIVVLKKQFSYGYSDKHFYKMKFI